MVVRIGEHGVWECSGDAWDCSEDIVRPAHSLPTAKLLFGVALSGRYREEIWTDSGNGPVRRRTVVLHGRFKAGKNLGCRCQPRISLSTTSAQVLVRTAGMDRTDRCPGQPTGGRDS